VLLGTRHFDVLGAWWDFSDGQNGGGSSMFRRSADVGICFFFFLSFSFWARLCCDPSKLVVLRVCYINIAGQKHVSWQSRLDKD
jgi:hypothetical protein